MGWWCFIDLQMGSVTTQEHSTHKEKMRLASFFFTISIKLIYIRTSEVVANYTFFSFSFAHGPHSDHSYMLLIVTTGRALWAYLGKCCAVERDFVTLSYASKLLGPQFGTMTMPMRTAQMHMRDAIRMERRTHRGMETSAYYLD